MCNGQSTIKYVDPLFETETGWCPRAKLPVIDLADILHGVNIKVDMVGHQMITAICPDLKSNQSPYSRRREWIQQPLCKVNNESDCNKFVESVAAEETTK